MALEAKLANDMRKVDENEELFEGGRQDTHEQDLHLVADTNQNKELERRLLKNEDKIDQLEQALEF